MEGIFLSATCSDQFQHSTWTRQPEPEHNLTLLLTCSFEPHVHLINFFFCSQPWDLLINTNCQRKRVSKSPSWFRPCLVLAWPWAEFLKCKNYLITMWVEKICLETMDHIVAPIYNMQPWRMPIEFESNYKFYKSSKFST